MVRQRFSASVVTMITAAYLVSSIGCTTGALRQSVMPSGNAHAVALPSDATDVSSPTARMATASADVQRLPSANQSSGQYAVAPAQYNTPITSGVNYDNVDLDVAEVVRGQEYPNGPLKEFMFNPYVIGAAIIAAIAIPLAVDDGGAPPMGP